MNPQDGEIIRYLGMDRSVDGVRPISGAAVVETFNIVHRQLRAQLMNKCITLFKAAYGGN
jgi:hypothetical protein